MLVTASFQGHGFQFVFQLVFLPYTLQLPSISHISVLRTAFKKIIFEQAQTSHSNNLGFFAHIKTDYSGRTKFFDRKVGINISDPCTRESKNKFGSKCDAFGADNYEQ